MSIVTLKRKSHATHFKISHNKGFNLNGTRHQRSSFFVGGSTSFNNTVNRTRFRGAEPIGHGSCCGKYKKNIINSHSCCNGTFDNKQAKKSVKNTKGYLSRKNVWLTHGYPKFVYQPQASTNYETYYSKITNCNGCKNEQNNDSGVECNKTSHLPSNMNNVKRNLNVKNYNKKIRPLSQGEYIKSEHKCNKCLPPPPEKREFPPAVNNCGCNIKVSTQEEAINMGLYN
tara:strand:+ start:695 stop:1378 length:684 start_codon:yes stop_codon:yes gene_type:complete